MSKTLALIAVGVALFAAVPARADKLVHKEQTLYRTVWVEDDADGVRCLRFSRRKLSLYQTCVDPAAPNRLVLPYTRMMMAALYLNPTPRRILILGLGGGVLPTALAKLLPDASIDVAELDPAVVRIAGDYFGFHPDSRVRVTVSDGRVFVKRAIRSHAVYDLVMLDAFDQQYIPEHLETREFLQEVGQILAPDGVRWSPGDIYSFNCRLTPYLRAIFVETAAGRRKPAGTAATICQTGPTHDFLHETKIRAG